MTPSTQVSFTQRTKIEEQRNFVYQVELENNITA